MNETRALVCEGELRDWTVFKEDDNNFWVTHYVGGEDTDCVDYDCYITYDEALRVATELNTKDDPETYQWYRDVELSM